MEDLKRLRFIAANYSCLQGFKFVPQGLLLILLALWGNSLRKPATTVDLVFPLLASLIAAIFYLSIDRYYVSVFGQIHRTIESRRLDGLIQLVGGIVALIAFVIDVSLKLPVSTLGLVFAAAFLADYLRVTRFAQERFLRYYVVMAVVMIAVSVSPLIGPIEWWQSIGVRHPVLGAVMLMGLLITVTGVLVHLTLIHTLLLIRGVSNGESS